MKRQWMHVVVGGLASLVIAAAPAAAQRTDKPTLAIVDFEAAPAGSVLPPPQLGAAIADLMLDKLVASDRFRVLDGRWLDTGGRRPHTPAGFDALRANAEASGVDYLVLGSVTRFSTENRQRSLGAAALFRPILGGMRRKKTELALAMTVRVVDVRTGEVKTTVSSLGTSGRRNLSLGGLGLLRGGAAAVSVAASGFRDALLDEALQRAVAGAAHGLVNAAPRLARRDTEIPLARYQAADLLPDRRFDWHAFVEVPPAGRQGPLTRIPRVPPGS